MVLIAWWWIERLLLDGEFEMGRRRMVWGKREAALEF
jgi:hypothetical protein